MACSCSYQAELMKCISGAQTAVHAGPEPDGTHRLIVSPASIDVNECDRQSRTLPPVVLVI